MSKLSPEQFAQVEQWASEGANLNQIQDRLKSEFDINLTYMEARLMMLDIGVKIKDKPKEAEKKAEPEVSPEGGEGGELPASGEASGVPGELVVDLDKIAIPGAMVSGKVTFSDGQKATWYIDEMNRLGLGGVPPTYQPPKADISAFQQELDRLLQQSGMV
jgi:hypothetical protein